MKNQVNHTPGPWRLNPMFTGMSDKRYAVVSESGLHVADVTSYGAFEETAEANAALIASAPDLLRQRDELLRTLEIIRAMATPVQTLPWEKTPPTDFAKTMDAIANQARAALATAQVKEGK